MRTSVQLTPHVKKLHRILFKQGTKRGTVKEILEEHYIWKFNPNDDLEKCCAVWADIFPKRAQELTKHSEVLNVQEWKPLDSAIRNHTEWTWKTLMLNFNQKFGTPEISGHKERNGIADNRLALHAIHSETARNIMSLLLDAESKIDPIGPKTRIIQWIADAAPHTFPLLPSMMKYLA